MRVRAALLVAACAGMLSSSGAAARFASHHAPARPLVVALSAPDAGDVSYGVAQVRIVPRSFGAPAGAGRLVFAQRIGGLSIAARSSDWRALHATTRVYVAVSRVTAAGGNVRDVAFFIVRRRGAGGRSLGRSGTVVFSIANAQPVIGSFWVRGLDGGGYARIFAVRDLLATALGNWGRYLAVLRAAHAMAAAAHPIDLGISADARAVASRASHRARGLWTGGEHPTPRARAVFRLLADALGDPLRYAAAKTSPLVVDFIAHDLNNPPLARRWLAVTASLPLRVPDRYAAAAQEEKRFTHVRAPRISSTAVTIADTATNSADQFSKNLSDNATILSVSLAGCDSCTPGRVTGGTYAGGQNIDCPSPDLMIDTCVASFLTGQTWETLTATAAPGWMLFQWHGCDAIVAGNCRVLVGGSNRAVTAEFHLLTSTVIIQVASNTGGAGTVTASPSGDTCRSTCVWQLSPGDHERLTAAPDAGSTFTRWGGQSNIQGCDSTSADTCDVTVPADSNVYVQAYFDALGDPPPAASFTVSPSQPQPPETAITFDGSASTDPDGQIVDYRWNFGDGTPAVDSGTTPTQVHSYFCYGTVTATLTVTDESGQTAQASGNVTITPQPGWNHC